MRICEAEETVGEGVTIIRGCGSVVLALDDRSCGAMAPPVKGVVVVKDWKPEPGIGAHGVLPPRELGRTESNRIPTKPVELVLTTGVTPLIALSADWFIGQPTLTPGSPVPVMPPGRGERRTDAGG